MQEVACRWKTLAETIRENIQSELRAKDAERDIENTPKYNRPNCIRKLARRIQVRRPQGGIKPSKFKRAKNSVYKLKLPVFWRNYFCRTWGVPSYSPMRTIFLAKNFRLILGVPPPPFPDKIRETLFERLPQANVPVVYILSAVFNSASNFTAQLDLDVCPASSSSTKTKIRH